MDDVLILQGGGALGAYECGVYQALVPWLEARGRRLAVVCGTSIGAINASIIVARYAENDRGAAALLTFWHDLANGSLPFLPLPQAGGWNAMWTSLLSGNPRLFAPLLPWWNFIPPVAWAPLTAFYETTPMERTLAKHFTMIGPGRADPRLIVTAVDIDKIRTTSFDSWDTGITPRHVVASGSLPPAFPATMIDGTRYWDGGLWSNTPLREALNAIQDKNTSGPEGLTECMIFIVDLFTPASSLPPLANNLDVWALRDRVIFQDKTRYDVTVSEHMNHHIEFVERLRRELRTLPPDQRSACGHLEALVEEEYGELRTRRRLKLSVTKFARAGTDGPTITFDFSPANIHALIEQGRAEALAVLSSIGASRS